MKKHHGSWTTSPDGGSGGSCLKKTLLWRRNGGCIMSVGRPEGQNRVKKGDRLDRLGLLGVRYVRLLHSAHDL